MLRKPHPPGLANVAELGGFCVGAVHVNADSEHS